MLPYRNLSEKRELIKKDQLSLKENIQFFLQNIEKNKNLNAYNFVFNDCIDSTDEIENKIKNNRAGKLAGAVIAVKDLLSIKNRPLTCSSKILEGFEATYTATAIQKLIDEDAIIVGKTSCDEFAMGGSNESSAFGPVLNPHNTDHVPGGSSGGSAAAVAANLCDAAIGTDTGGSIRQPSSYCGIFGLKPTYGRVSRYGLTAYGSSFDTIGPMTNNVLDAAVIMEVLSGKDQQDSTSAEIQVPDYSKHITEESKFKIGIPKEYFTEGLSLEVKNAINARIEELSNAGHEIIDISLPHTEYAISTYYILAMAEASANLSRYDGARYGFRSDDIKNLEDMYVNSRSEAFGEEVKRRIMLGTYVLSAGYYDAYYKKAQKVRRMIQNDFLNAFNNVDLVLSPTAPSTAFKLGELVDDPLQMYLMDIYTTPANLAGIPAISIPIGTGENNLPIGIQFMGNHFDEVTLLHMGKLLEE